MRQLSLLILLITIPFLIGFDYTKHSIPIAEILTGGPPKDGIPALMHPKFVSAEKADFVKKNDRVLGLFINGEAKAYPIKIMNWHEIVNDSVGGKKIMVSYCPLCGTGMAFDPSINGKHHTFGVSGLLYKSDVLMYDHQTESLWSQIKQEAVTGELTGTRIKMINLNHTTWESWRKKHPKTRVLSMDTGYTRNYFHDPYTAYAGNDLLMFPVGKLDDRYPTKSWILGVTLSGHSKAYPFIELKNAPRSFTDTIGKEEIKIVYEPQYRETHVFDNQGKEIPTIIAYWFAWTAFNPDTAVYTAPSRKNP